MNLQGLKSVCPLGPVSMTAAAALTSASIDCKGYEELQLVVTKTTHATDYITVLTIQQSDDTVLTNFAAVTGYVAGTDWTLASLTGGTNAATEKAAGVFNIDLRGKKRYFRVLVTNGGATGIVGITGTLARGEQAPITATNQNAGVVVNPS
ncbi:hypothetical protein UFOVP525_32 [uncultured Caudovirales phage]|uniref:Uncharacterized protein n=1 Tax=uncultured Caudovirales phage TaxID=2100421 RepID=A0A6J5MST4_9CAUD|nr:hypothetical protein UFOVP525_32 [uncultured Caudovirales phage]